MPSDYELASCAPVSLIAQLYYLPAFIQCGLLYPALDRFFWVRWLRLALTPLSVYLSLKLPIDHCFTPTTRRGYENLALACTSFTIAAKSIEWGTLKSYQDGNFVRRLGFPTRQFDLILNSKEKDQVSDSFQTQAQINYKPISSSSFEDWLGWTLEVLSSPRGQQYGWGIKISPHTQKMLDTVKRMHVVNTVHVFATGYAILCRDQGTPTKALRYLGVPSLYGEEILAEGLLNLAFGFYLISRIELGYGYLTLLIHVINLIDTHWVRLPNWLMRSCDSKLYSPQFNQPHRSHSLSFLWGKAWHQLFRQPFLILGGFPATKLARKFGLSTQSQRVAAMFGCFFVSAALHEWAIHLVARQPHSEPHIFLKEFPGSFLYFILQPLGILIEPYLIPWVPGGGIVWVYAFTLLTVTPFRIEYFKGHRLIDHGYPSVNLRWFITSLLVPCSTSKS